MPTTEAGTSQTIRTDTRDGITTEMRIEFGCAARNNRARHSGQKIHKLFATYITSIEDGAAVRPGTFAAEFLRTRKPVLTGCHPLCGCTVGQHAGRPYQNLTAADVTCSKCRPSEEAAR